MTFRYPRRLWHWWYAWYPVRVGDEWVFRQHVSRCRLTTFRYRYGLNALGKPLLRRLR